MGKVKTVLRALKSVGEWVTANSGLVLGAVDGVAKLTENKKAASLDERLQEVEEKVNQLGEAALEINQKIDTELEALRKQMRTMKIMMIAMGAALAVVAVVAIILAVLL